MRSGRLGVGLHGLFLSTALFALSGGETLLAGRLLSIFSCFLWFCFLASFWVRNALARLKIDGRTHNNDGCRLKKI